MDQKKSSGLFRSEAVQAYLERLKTEPIIGEMIGIHLRLDSWIHEYRYANQKRHEYNMPPLDKTHYQLRAYRSVAIEFGHVITKYTEFSDDILIIIFDVIDELNSIDVDTSVAYQHLLKLNCDKPVCKQTVSDLAL